MGGMNFEYRTLTQEEWTALVESKQVEDISDQLPDSFLMVYQWMRAKIKYDGKTWLASGWNPPSSDKPYVNLQEVSE